MAVRHPCYRHHARGVWIAGCPDCTAWYRATLVTRHRETEDRAHSDSGSAADSGEPADQPVETPAAA
jgi:hypothetical protein